MVVVNMVVGYVVVSLAKFRPESCSRVMVEKEWTGSAAVEV